MPRTARHISDARPWAVLFAGRLVVTVTVSPCGSRLCTDRDQEARENRARRRLISSFLSDSDGGRLGSGAGWGSLSTSGGGAPSSSVGRDSDGDVVSDSGGGAVGGGSQAAARATNTASAAVARNRALPRVPDDAGRGPWPFLSAKGRIAREFPGPKPDTPAGQPVGGKLGAKGVSSG